MAQKTSLVLLRLFFSVFALAFGWIWLCSAFANRIYRHGSWLAVLLALVFGLLYWLAYRLLCRLSAFTRRWGWALCTAAVVAIGLAVLVNGMAMRYTPSYDLEAIYGGGITWAQDGTMTGNARYMQYFHMFPDNLGGAYLFRCVFGISRLFGIQDTFVVALAVNTAMLLGCVVLVYIFLSNSFGNTSAVFSLVVFLSFMPVYMMGAVFYTDLLTVLFPVLTLTLYQQARRFSGWKKPAMYMAAGVVAGAGAVVKITVLIILVAVAIASFITPPRRIKKGHYRQQVFAVLAMVAGAAVVLAGFRIFVRVSQLDAARLERESMPFSHWVAMGLIGNGGYDEDDYARAMSLPSKTARKETNRQLIATRLLEPSLADLAKLFTRKGVRCFGDGTYDLAIFLDDNPHQRAPQHEWVLFDGRYYAAYSQLSQGMYLALLSFAIFAAGKAALRIKSGWRIYRNPAPWLAFFGLLCFLMLWETNSRYTLNYMPVLFICASAGVALLPRLRSKVPKG